MTQQTVQHEATTTANVVSPPANVSPLLTPTTANTNRASGNLVASRITPPSTTASIANPPVANTQTAATNFTKAADMQWKVFQANNEWIRFADLKAGALLTANGALLAVILSALKNSTDVVRASPFVLSLALLSGAALLTSVGYCLGCISPKTAQFHTRHDSNTESLLFFEHIAAFGKEEYRKSAQTLDSDESAYDHIVQQVWINARVAWAKYRQVTLAIQALAGSIGFALLAVLVAWFR